MSCDSPGHVTARSCDSAGYRGSALSILRWKISLFVWKTVLYESLYDAVCSPDISMEELGDEVP